MGGDVKLEESGLAILNTVDLLHLSSSVQKNLNILKLPAFPHLTIIH